MQLILNTTPEVQGVFDRYPDNVSDKMLFLRKLVLEVAESLDDVQVLEETLKWGEPSYIAKKGSTIRMDWKAKTPNQYAMYFKCTSKLVPGFKMAFGDLFQYEGNRAIVFGLEDEVPVAALKQCIAAALRYHRVKDKQGLGIRVK